MAVDFSNTLIVAISATALFDLTHLENQHTLLTQTNPKTATALFRQYVQAHENDLLAKGTGFPLIEALLNLNRFLDTKDYHDESPLVEVVIISKSTPDMGIGVLNAIRHYQLPITRSAFISGTNVADYIKDFGVDLFLTTNHEDAQAVIDAKVCACAIVDATPIASEHLDSSQLRIAFDGDAVLFDDSSELIYRQQGLQAFHDHERQMADNPINKGPYADFLIKLSNLQDKLQDKLVPSDKNAPICIALVTARNAPADLRAIKTLRAWGVNVDMAFFLGGLEKTNVLKTFAPHIFFDDSIKHIDLAKTVVPSAHVPYHSSSPLQNYADSTYLPNPNTTPTPLDNSTKTYHKKKNK